MFEHIQYIVIVGAVVQMFGVATYMKETLKGSTQPNKVTWLLWAVSPLIATFASLSDGVGWSVVPVFVSGFGPLLVFIISFVNKNSYWKLNKIDYGCGAFSVLALVLWAITKQPVAAIALSIVSDALASIPTLIKSWRYPETETPIAYITALFSVSVGFLTIQTWNFSSCAFPIYLALMEITFIIALYRKRIFKKQHFGSHWMKD